MVIRDYVESDHQSLVVRLRGGKGRKRNGRGNGGRRICSGRWNEEGRGEFRREIRGDILMEDGLDEAVGNVSDRIRQILKRLEERGVRNLKALVGEKRIQGAV